MRQPRDSSRGRRDTGDGRLLEKAANRIASGDHEEGFKLARGAALANEIGSWTYLGVLLSKGTGVARSNIQAVECYTRADESGDKKGTGLLAMCKITGTGTSKDVSSGLEMLLSAVKAGDVTAMKNYAWILRHGERYGIPRDDDAAKDWVLKAHAVRSSRRSHDIPVAQSGSSGPLSSLRESRGAGSSPSSHVPGSSQLTAISLATDQTIPSATDQATSRDASGDDPGRRESESGDASRDDMNRDKTLRFKRESPESSPTDSSGNSVRQSQSSSKPRSPPPLTGLPTPHSQGGAHRPKLFSYFGPSSHGDTNQASVDTRSSLSQRAQPYGTPHHNSGRIPMPGLPPSPSTHGNFGIGGRPPPSFMEYTEGGPAMPSTSTSNIPQQPPLPQKTQQSTFHVQEIMEANEETPLVDERSDVVAEESSTHYVDQLSTFDRFLINTDVRHVGIPLGFTAVTAMWRAMFLNYHAVGAGVFRNVVSLELLIEGFCRSMWYGLWMITFILYSIFLTLYAIRSRKYPYLLIEDFQDAILTNFFAAIAIVAGVLTVIVPPPFANLTGRRAMFIFLLLYKGFLSVGFWYRDWLFNVGANTLRRTSPIYFMAVINFFILSTISAQVHWKELALYLFMLGTLFWLVVFTTSFSFIAKTYDHDVDKPSPTLFCFLAPPAAAGIGWITISAERGENPLNDVTRFYAAILIFLLVILARLSDLFITLDFNVGWWAYVFPLGSASTMIILLAKVMEDNIPVMLIAYSAFISTLVLWVLVVFRTLQFIEAGKIPMSPVALQTYERQCREDAVSGTAETPIARLTSGFSGLFRNHIDT